MARIRSIHPDVCRDDDLALVSPRAERTFTRLWVHLDDDGRALDHPKLLVADLYPLHDDVDADVVHEDLAELEKHGLVIRYSVDGKRYVSAKPDAWARFQKPRHPTPSKLPGPQEDDGSAPWDYDSVTADAVDLPRSAGALRQGEGVGGGGGEGVGGGDAPAPPPAPDPIEDRFERWWQSYPRHAKNGKPGGGGARKPAASAFRRLSERKRVLAEQATPNYRAWCESPEGEYPVHASKWLNEERWEQWLEPAQGQERGQSYGEVLPDGTMRGVM